MTLSSHKLKSALKRPHHGNHEERSSKLARYHDSPGVIRGGNGDRDDPASLSSSEAEEPVHSRKVKSKSLSNQSLESLQNENARHVMDTVDRLRKAGLGAIIQLPQIVTVGDQSSGKSSTLEAITGIPFPRKENLCTRFATQIVLRRASTISVSVNIIPDSTRPAIEQERLTGLTLQLDDFKNLGDLVERATDAMGLNNTDGKTARAFARDVLNIEISGPTRPHLTLVDLPGLIHSENKQQSHEDIELIKSIVEDCMKEKRTIVLAIVSAKNDYANQIVLKKARDLNAADRTMGIITKVDTIEPDGESERSWIDLAQNKDVFFQLGWHMLRNRTPNEKDNSLADRDQSEARFFDTGAYEELDRSTVGIDALRHRLSELLHAHLTRELPELQRELGQKYKETSSALGKLGRSRVTVKEQRRFLMQIGQDFEKTTEAAINGHYDNPFFLMNDQKGVVSPDDYVSRLRARVQNANIQFSNQIRQYGAKYKITLTPELKEIADDEPVPNLAEKDIAPKTPQKTRAWAEAITWVRDMLEKSRGRELPGNFNPLLISQIFWEQSSPWDELSRMHVERISNYCEEFVCKLLKSMTTADVYHRIFAKIIEPQLKARKEAALQELDRILKDKNSHTMTYNHYYTSNISKFRVRQHQSQVDSLVARHTTLRQGFSGTHTEINARALVNEISGPIVEADMDRFSAEDALLNQMAYYKDELKYFVNCVTKQVIERRLMKDLATDIISGVAFGDMEDRQISSIAKESPNVVGERERLRKKLDMLEEGQEAFRKELGDY